MISPTFIHDLSIHIFIDIHGFLYTFQDSFKNLKILLMDCSVRVSSSYMIEHRRMISAGNYWEPNQGAGNLGIEPIPKVIHANMKGRAECRLNWLSFMGPI